jgi:hypothetical protein
MESSNGNGEAHIATTLEPQAKVAFAAIAAANQRSVAAELRFLVLNHIDRAAA